MSDKEEDFIKALIEVFGEKRTDEAIEEGEAIKVLEKLWNRAIDYERRHVFHYIRRNLQGFDDKELLVQLSWVIGNGTYRRVGNLSVRPWWLKEDRDWKAYVSDRLVVRRMGARQWEIGSRESDEMIARISQEDGKYEVWHTPPDPAMAAEVRVFLSWPDAMSDVVARQVMREKERDLRVASRDEEAENA